MGSSNKTTTTNVYEEPTKLQLPEPQNLQELHNLIVHTKRKKDFNNDQEQSHIHHGFPHINAARDRAHYPKQQYPKSGKPIFNPRTQTQSYGTRPRGGKGKNYNNKKLGNQLTFKEFRTPYVVPPTTTPQRKDVSFKERPKYWHGLCTNCNIHGHHPSKCDEMQQYWNTLEHY